VELRGRTGTIFVGVTVMARSETDGADTWLVDLPPTARQSWSALAVAAVGLVAFGAVAPFAGRPLAELNAFFPSLDAIVLVTDLITSVLLFAQFSISNLRSLFVLASGYLFTALLIIHMHLPSLAHFRQPDFSVPVSKPGHGFSSSGMLVSPLAC
jgi:hypothetical protein